MNQYFNIKKLVSLILFLALVSFSFYWYIELSPLWTAVGRGEVLFNDLLYKLEFPLFLTIALLLYFSTIKNPAIRILVPLLPVLTLYALFDGFYSLLGRSPSPSDFQNISSLMAFSPTMALGVILILLAIGGVIALLLKQAYHSGSINQFKRALALRAVLIPLMLITFSTQGFREYHHQHFNYTVWSQEDTIRDNGRFSSFIYYTLQEQENQQKLQLFTAEKARPNLQVTLYPGNIAAPRNIHLVVLESFIDPRDLENIQFSQPVLAPELIPFLNNDKDFSLVVSPIYGGGTAQAEFELLTGVQAMSKVNRIEFNVMKGGPIQSFIKALKDNHYSTVATIATGTGFFNSKQAYRSMGFDHIVYLEEDESFMASQTDSFIFDGDLFTYNLEYLKNTLPQAEGPVFNYVLGMYGHTPFIRNLEERPDVVEVTHPNEKVQRLSNQFYYRTKALAHYLEQLMAMDKNAIIYVTSDHLPSILNETTTYKRDNKVNISLFFDGGNNIDVTGKKFYEIPWFIWDTLSQSGQQRQFNQAEMETFYFEALSQSIAE